MNSMEALEWRLRALEDREAIRDLIAGYGPLADSGDARAVADLWTGDGVYEVLGFARAQGHEAIAGLITGPVHQALMARGCGHLLGPVTIVLDGDRAELRGHSVLFRRQDSGDGFEAYRVSANRWQLRRTAAAGHGGWRVTHRSNAVLDGDPAARLLLAAPPAHPAS